jgi:hypothetical protein
MRFFRLCVVAFFSTVTAFAQTVVMGTIENQLPATFSQTTGPQTFVELGYSANRAGNVTTVMLGWGGVVTPASCANGLKIKFLRKTLGTFTVVAERGPFSPQAGFFTVTLSPPVAVLAGDLLAVVQLQNYATCGGPGVATMSDRETIIRYPGIDLPTGSFATGGLLINARSLMARATSDPNVAVAMIPVVGSAAGGLTFFRTDLQAVNFTGRTLTGKLVFHPAGHAATAADPSVNYSYSGFNLNAVSIPDVVASMGQSGVGSMDIVPTSGPAPKFVTRIYSDSGAGTSGFTTDSLSRDHALALSNITSLIAPADLTNFRMNVGIRTLEDGATISISTVAGGVTRTYSANYFEQGTLAAFLGEAPFVNGVYGISIDAGSAFIYTTLTDNRTNDTSIRFLTVPR